MKIFIKSSILLNFLRISIKILRFSPICLSGVARLAVSNSVSECARAKQTGFSVKGLPNVLQTLLMGCVSAQRGEGVQNCEKFA